jgi:putative transposase
MQTELLNRQRWRTRIELANAIFEYLEIFHNRQRRHSSLGMLTRSSMKGSTPSPYPSPDVNQHGSDKPGEHHSWKTAAVRF